MASRTVIHRFRDFGRLASRLGVNGQIARFAWYTFVRTRRTGRPVRFRIRGLEGRPIDLRPGTSDFIVLYGTFGANHDVPPVHLDPGEVAKIWDLGTNIGLTALAYAERFPKARISGVELDPENADCARRHLAGYGTRCDVVTGAVWVENGQVDYGISDGSEHGAAIGAQPGASRRGTAAAYTLDTLFAADMHVDFVKMDIEGTEARVLKENTSWAGKVGTIKVECHHPYSVGEAERDLQALGFFTSRSTTHWSSILGTRFRQRQPA